MLYNIQVNFYPVSGIWELRISKVGVEDVVEYECQSNTEPKREFSISLGVADTLAVISGPNEMFLKAGSQLCSSLCCRSWMWARFKFSQDSCFALVC